MASDNVYGTPLSGDADTILNGMVLRVSDDNRVVRAQADSSPNVQGVIGVNGSGFVELGGPVNVVSTAVRQPVLCEAGLALLAGDPLYVSDTQAGYATNIAPTIAVTIGVVEDVGPYVRTGQVFATLSPAGVSAGGSGGVQSITGTPPILVDNTDPANPVISLDASASPLFQLALSYGQGPAGNADLDAGDSFWFQAQSINGTPEPDQVHEWPVARDLAFIGLTVFVDDATIALAGDEPRFIVTVDGVDTIFQVNLTAGAHVQEPFQTNGVIAIPAGSRVGVRFDGSGIDAGSTLRCEIILDGAETGTPIPPPPIPTAGLLVDWQSENYVITPPTSPGGSDAQGNLTDVSGNGNDVSTGGTLLIHVPTIVPNAFNTHPGIGATRANTFGMTKVGPTWLAGNAPRTFAVVLEGTNIDLGELLHRRSLAGNSWSIDITNTTTPQPFWANNAGTIDNNGSFVDFNGQKAVLMLWTAGTIGAPLFATVNGVTIALTGTMAAEGAATNFIELFGFTFGPRFDGIVGRLLTWNRVLTVSERIGVVSNLTEGYL